MLLSITKTTGYLVYFCLLRVANVRKYTNYNNTFILKLSIDKIKPINRSKNLLYITIIVSTVRLQICRDRMLTGTSHTRIELCTDNKRRTLRVQE